MVVFGDGDAFFASFAPGVGVAGVSWFAHGFGSFSCVFGGVLRVARQLGSPFAQWVDASSCVRACV